MKARLWLPSVLGIAVMLGAPSARAADRFEIDTTHSNIIFLVEHLGYSRMVG